MKKIKLFRLLALFVVLIASINNVWAGTRTVYLECARLNWAEANANLYINNADNLTGAVLFSLVDGESSVYSAEVSDTWTNTTVYFFRYKSDNSEQWASFSATLSATKNCGVPYYGNSSWSNGYMGYYFPTATKLYISAYQTYNGGSSASDFATANARLWVYYYLSNGNGGAVKDGHVEATYIESVDSYNTYYYEVPKGIWDAVVLVRTIPSTDFCWSGDNYWGKSIDLDGIELGKNRNHNDTWSAYAPSLSSVALAPATAYSGGGTDDNPYLVSPSATVRVNATPTNPGSLSDGNLTVKYTYKDASNTQLKGQSTDDYYQFTASSVNGTTYSVKVEANNYYGATAGATARTSSILYFQVSATPAVALSVSTAGPVASGTELTLTATPSNTTVTPTYSYYYSTNSGSTYSPIAGTDETPVTSTTQTFTPAVNSPGTYQFKVIMHHNSTDYPCTVFPTTDVQQRRTMAVKNKYTDLYGVETIVNASTASVTGIYNTLSATRDAAPDGYAFAGWEKTSNLSFVSGDATSSSTTVTMSASADDQTLTALYTAKKRIYFDNKMTNWSGTIYVYFFDNSSGWYNSGIDGKGPGLVPTHSAHHSEMTHIENTSIWYYEYDGKYNPTQYVAFTKGCMDGWYYVKNGSYAYLEDFNECLPMYMASSTWQEYNYSGNHKYGYWKRYNTTNSGYKLIGLYDGNSDKDYWDIGADEVEFKSTTPNSNTFKATIHLNNATWNFKVSRCAGARLGNTGTMTPTNHSGWEMTPIATDCHIEIPSGGDYEFTINLGSDHIYLSVEYPLLANDYRLLHTGYLHTTDDANHAHPTQSIRHLMKADTTTYDTVSVFIDAAHKGSLKMQKCVDPSANSGKGSWTDTITGISLTGATTTGIYSFVITQTTTAAGVRTASVAPLAENFKYTGNLYIRTDGADGGWEEYKSVENNKLQYSDYAKTHSGYDYYFCHWMATDKNLHATIANDYSPSISDTITTGESPFMFDALPYQANVRYMYNSATNHITRAYLNGANEGGEAVYLSLRTMSTTSGETHTGDSIKNTDDTYTNITKDGYVSIAKFKDLGNWVYQKDLKVLEGTHARLISDYYYSSTNHYQYFKGSAGDWNPSTTEELISGTTTNSWQTLRLVYDFKTNHLVAAWMPPSSDVNTAIAINADVMIIREEQKDAKQLTFGASGSLSKVDTVYGVMQFNKWSLNNRNKTNTADSTRSVYARDLYWISFPFDVKLNDVFGFGNYGTHWIIEYYDGKGRAKNGFWADSPSNWKFVYPSMRDTFKLEANVGYILALDLDHMTPSSAVWENVEDVYLYFPSKDKVGNISKTTATVTFNQTGYNCTINRQQPNEAYDVNKNRTIADSYWHCIGVPSFANKAHDINDDWTISEGDPSEVDAGDYPSIQSWGTGDLLFVYRWNSSDNSLVPENATSFTFNAMHSYMVQYNGNTITWSTVTTPVKSIAARQMDIPDLNFCLQLLKDSVRQDQTFVRFTDKAGVTSGFEFNYDMSKEYNGNRGNIWTLTTNGVQVAGNSMPHPLATTIVPVGVKIATTGDYTFSIPEGTNGGDVWLLDNQTNSRTNLGLMDYTVNLTTGTIDGRFSLEFPVQNVVTDMETVDNGQLTVDNDVRKVFVGGRLYIIRDGKAYDATGAQVK